MLSTALCVAAGPRLVPTDGLDSTKFTVSFPSTSRSGMMATVNDLVATLAGMVTVTGGGVKSTLAVAVPGVIGFTLTSTVMGAVSTPVRLSDTVALTVVSVPSVTVNVGAVNITTGSLSTIVTTVFATVPIVPPPVGVLRVRLKFS
jgi:hypothetical protein